MHKKCRAPDSGARHLGSAAETIAAVDRAVIAGLEGHLAGDAAGGTNGIIHLAGGTAVPAAGTAAALAGITAGLAALGLVLEAALCEKFLLTGGKGELLATIFANDHLVLEHKTYLF